MSTCQRARPVCRAPPSAGIGARPARPPTPRLAHYSKRLDPPCCPVTFGCPACHQTGYQGRLGIFELLVPDQEVKRLIIERDTGQLYKTAVASGMTTMVLDGLAKAAEGSTTIAEVIRVTGETADEL